MEFFLHSTRQIFKKTLILAFEENSALSCQHGLFSAFFLADCAIFFQFDLVCGNDWKITLAQVVYMFGILLGASTSGMISDKFGRKKTIIFFSTAMSAFSIAVAFANCYDFFVFLRWGLAFSSGTYWKFQNNSLCFLRIFWIFKKLRHSLIV